MVASAFPGAATTTTVGPMDQPLRRTAWELESQQGPETAEPPRTRRRRWLFLLVALATLIGAGFLWLSWSLPLERALEPLPSPAVVLVSADGKPFARRGAYKEAPIDVETLPAHVPAAFIAIEDRRFYRHWGIDLRGIARAARENLRAGGVRQGGSTITQQLAKTTFLTADRSLKRKLQEVFIALWLELRLSKNEILERYLSGVYFGEGVYGLRAAARHYFDKPPEQLSLDEAAILAAAVKAPSRLNPADNPKGAEARARLVAAAMAETGAITLEQAASCCKAKVKLNRAALPVGGYFADWVSPQVKDAFPAAYGEVRVTTTLDSRLQARAERVIARALAAQGKRRNVGQAALVAMRPDGAVVAMVGGRSYRDSQFNRAVQARRQPGSAFKLFVYLAAIRDGARPDMVVSNEPLTLGDWSPKNFGGEAGGYLTLKDAFAKSSNLAAVRVAETAGRANVIRAARDLGVTSPLTDDATLALGSSEVTLLELTAAYAAVAAGESVRPYGLQASEPTRGRPIPPRVRERMMELLYEAVEHGTGRAARLPGPVYGKTGTTQDHRDAVFVGFNDELVVGVWVGNDDQSPMKGVTGGGQPAEIWRDFVGNGARRVDPPPAPPAPPEPSLDLPGWLKRLLGRWG
ncbi:MAG: transglycosylase domain-containing protein [Phenylobacterium sp.]|nr:transglycosylase domain-containing protein [Phenylobacterium sp.]